MIKKKNQKRKLRKASFTIHDLLVEVDQVTPKKKKSKFKDYTPKETPYRASGHGHLPSGIDRFLQETPPRNISEKKVYEGDLAARERAAQEEIERKKKCVAPAFNKGNYTYIATTEQAKWAGRK